MQDTLKQNYLVSEKHLNKKKKLRREIKDEKPKGKYFLRCLVSPKLLTDYFIIKFTKCCTSFAILRVGANFSSFSLTLLKIKSLPNKKTFEHQITKY